MFRKLRSLFFILVLLLIIFISACQNSVHAPPTVDNNSMVTDDEISLITDLDVDTASLESASNEEFIEGLEVDTIPEGGEVDLSNDGDVDLTTQAALPNADGHVYYIKHNPNVDKPWRLYCFNQVNNKKILIYSGKRAVQSITGDDSCKTVIFSMREKMLR